VADNRARARAFLGMFESVPVLALATLEGLLDAAEDRGGEVAAEIPTADPLTVEALRDTLMDGLGLLVGKRVTEADIADRGNNLAQAVIGSFAIRLLPDEETDPLRPAPDKDAGREIDAGTPEEWES